MAFGDRAGRINTHKEKRNTLRTGALQRREAMGDLFKGHTELIGQTLKVMSGLLGGGLKRGVGHKRRAGEIIG
jgi:hypothetical protein